MITIITVNNRKQRRTGRLLLLLLLLLRFGRLEGGRQLALLRNFPRTPDFLFFFLFSFYFLSRFPSGSRHTASRAQHMQYGTMRSVALALTQTALGPSERQSCCLLAARSQAGTVCTWSLFSVSGDAKVGIQGGGIKYGWRGRKREKKKQAGCCFQG